jgi:hypothetical protein
MCTIAFLTQLFGYMPPAGTVITIPRHIEQSATFVQKVQAKRCLRRYGIKWRIEGD